MRGFSRRNMLPVLPPVSPPRAPMDMNESTFGSSWTIGVDGLLVGDHVVEGDSLGRLGEDHDDAAVLAGQEALGD